MKDDHMTKITEFTPANLKTLRAELDIALAALNATLGQKYGVSLNLGKASYLPNMASFKLECGLLEASGEAVSKYRAEFQVASYRRLLMLEENDTDLTVLINREAWKLEGLAMSRRKYPIVMKRVSDGKVTLYTDAIVPLIAAARAKTTAAA